MELLHYSEDIPKKGIYDVIVAGGGVAGIAAALSAARGGKKTLLLEKQTVLGGLATSGLINYWVPLCNGRGKWIIRGMAEELFSLSLKYGFDTLPDDWKNGEPQTETLDRCVTWFSSGLFSLSVLKLLRNAGVTILYDTLVSVPVMEGNHCTGVIVDTKSGRRFYGAGVIIDATGDADLLRRANMPTVNGRNYYTMIGEGVTLSGCKRAVEKNNVYYAYYRPTGGCADLYGGNHPKDMPFFYGAETETENNYLQQNQLLMLEKEKDKPRFERNIHMLPGMTQFRTSCRLDGNSTLTGSDAWKHCDTSIGTICDFERRDYLYEVPYGTLCKSGWDNIMTCGRSASASGWGWDVLRVIPPAILTGQAAGLAASQSLEERCPVSDINLLRLQQSLASTGVMIHMPEELITGPRPDSGALNPEHM